MLAVGQLFKYKQTTLETPISGNIIKTLLQTVHCSKKVQSYFRIQNKLEIIKQALSGFDSVIFCSGFFG